MEGQDYADTDPGVKSGYFWRQLKVAPTIP
jgi:hypothetical protein